MNDATVTEETREREEAPKRGKFRDILERLKIAKVWTFRWLEWVFTYVNVLLVFFIYRWAALDHLITMYGTQKDCTAAIQAGALGLGFIEDVVCATYLVVSLWAFDIVKKGISDCITDHHSRVVSVVGGVVNFFASWVLLVATLGPFVADLLLVRLRDMRFTFELVQMAIHEKDNASAAAISKSELHEAYANVVAVVIVATVFATIRVWTSWADLSRWSPADSIARIMFSRALAAGGSKNLQTSANPNHNDAMLELGETDGDSRTTTPKHTSFSGMTHDESIITPKQSRLNRVFVSRVCILTIILAITLVAVPAVVLAISHASSSLVAYSALNATLNELFVRGIRVTGLGFAPSTADGSIESANIYIHSATEDYELFRNDSLYRRTKGFHGDLAFDVNVSNDNPPNVLLIVVESFRFHDSHYLVGDEDPSNLFKGSNLTVTPNFDRWAKRGVAFSNMWSSWRTSRSVESLLFAQLPYDSVADSGMTGGKEDVELSGLPQLFKAKGYEPFFATGCKTDYDDWDKFLPSHGFEMVLSRNEMMKLAESDLGIGSDQWYAGDRRGFNWGVHDDLSFELLGNLLINKTKEQSDRVANGEPKKPLFLTHYTISSHTPFKARPKWYANAKKPDFSDLYEGEEYADVIKDYLEMRHFTDMELGKFLDRMANESILNDTIVVIVGDHGQAPEFGLDVPEARDTSVTRVASTIIAEGRLGDAVGLMIHDAVEQYDILNTLADITGVPDGGFLQDGVGRSLKRNVTFGERVVYSNNPSRKMSVVRGHQRLRYDEYSDSVLLHNADTDHDMATDLFPALNRTEKAKWTTWRNRGRRLNAYYTKRWDKRCLLAAEC